MKKPVQNVQNERHSNFGSDGADRGTLEALLAGTVFNHVPGGREAVHCLSFSSHEEIPMNIRTKRRIKACDLASLLILFAVLGAAQNSDGTSATGDVSRAMSARYEDLIWQAMVPELGNDSPQIGIVDEHEPLQGLMPLLVVRRGRKYQACESRRVILLTVDHRVKFGGKC